MTSAAPAERGPVLAEIVESLTTETPEAGVPPIVTIAPLVKFDPEMVTVVPPDVGPDVGLIAVTRGALFDGPVGVPFPPQDQPNTVSPTSAASVRLPLPVTTTS
jgi:hypothetical protein